MLFLLGLLLPESLTPQQATVDPCLLNTHRQIWHVGSLLLSPGSWCAQGFVCALQESVLSVLWKFCNQISLIFKVGFPGDYLSPGLGSLLWDLELSQQCKDLFGTVVLQFVG